MAERDVLLPMVAIQPTPISSERMKQVFSHLSARSQRLATDLPFFKQNAGALINACAHLARLGGNQQTCRQLLEKEPQLLRQLVALTTAALQQLAAHLDREIEVCRATAILADKLGWLLSAARVRPLDVHTPSAPADAANLRLIRDAGACDVTPTH